MDGVELGRRLKERRLKSEGRKILSRRAVGRTVGPALSGRCSSALKILKRLSTFFSRLVGRSAIRAVSPALNSKRARRLSIGLFSRRVLLGAHRLGFLYDVFE